MEDNEKTTKKTGENDNLDKDEESSALDGKGLHDLYRHATKLLK